MANIVSVIKVILNKKQKFSNLFTKFGFFLFNGRSASIFKISADYSINP